MASDPAVFSLLNWNIYGLHRTHLEERTKYIIDYIITHNPSVVFLQEVVHATWPTIVSSLNHQYHCYTGTPKAHYFNGLLILKSPNISILSEELEYVSFSSSTMGRYLIAITILCHGHKIHFMTSHSESLDAPNNITERKKQLKFAFDKMVQVHTQQSLSCIFGGDLNTRDSEISEIGLPECIIDTWEACGSSRTQKMTWNTNVPVSRCDRIYLCPRNGVVQPVSFSLLGGERLEGLGCFPSDHFGIWVKFCIKTS